MGIKEVIMERDGISEMEADDLIEEAKEYLQECLADGDELAAEHTCEEFFGLEPDYLIELL